MRILTGTEGENVQCVLSFSRMAGTLAGPSSFPALLEVRHPPTRPLPDLLMQTGAFTLRGCPHSALSVKTPPNLVQDSGAFPVRS